MTEKKKIIISIIIIVICVINIIIIEIHSLNQNHHTKEVTIIAIDNDTITVIDNDNLLWQFNGNEFKVNDKITIIMDTMNTNNIYDDQIIDVK